MTDHDTALTTADGMPHDSLSHSEIPGSRDPNSADFLETLDKLIYIALTHSSVDVLGVDVDSACQACNWAVRYDVPKELALRVAALRKQSRGAAVGETQQAGCAVASQLQSAPPRPRRQPGHRGDRSQKGTTGPFVAGREPARQHKAVLLNGQGTTQPTRE